MAYNIVVCITVNYDHKIVLAGTGSNSTKAKLSFDLSMTSMLSYRRTVQTAGMQSL